MDQDVSLLGRTLLGLETQLVFSAPQPNMETTKYIPYHPKHPLALFKKHYSGKEAPPSLVPGGPCLLPSALTDTSSPPSPDSTLNEEEGGGEGVTPPIPNTNFSPLTLASNQPCSKLYTLLFLFCSPLFPSRLWLIRA